MITFTTYGTWLQGDKRGYVNNGEICDEDRFLQEANRRNKKYETFRFSKEQKEIVKEAIILEAKRLNQRIYAIAVCSNHVHIAIGYNTMDVDEMARRYKMAGYFAIKEKGFKGKVWTRGYDKRLCFDEKALQSRIEYVKRHEGSQR